MTIKQKAATSALLLSIVIPCMICLQGLSLSQGRSHWSVRWLFPAALIIHGCGIRFLLPIRKFGDALVGRMACPRCGAILCGQSISQQMLCHVCRRFFYYPTWALKQFDQGRAFFTLWSFLLAAVGFAIMLLAQKWPATSSAFWVPLSVLLMIYIAGSFWRWRVTVADRVAFARDNP